MEWTLVAHAADGVPIGVGRSGGDGPPLLMIPGLGATRRVYEPIVPLLARSCRVAVLDPRGTGESGFTPGPYTMGGLAADAVAVLDELGWERAVVFGASMGGMVAQWVAIDHPTRVWRLLLASTGPGATHAVPADRAATRALLGKGARSPEEAYRLASTVLYEPGWAAAHHGEVEAEIRHRGLNPVRPQAFSAQYEAVRGHDSWRRLAEVRAPTLVMHGTADAVMPVGNGEALARRIPGARWLPLEGRGHLFWHEAPEESAAAVAGFAHGEVVGRPAAEVSWPSRSTTSPG